MSTFFVCASLLADDCGPEAKLISAKVKWVYDGDTFKLSTKHRLRVIGIDTPEVAHRGKPAEPLAGQAREAVRELLSQYSYRIRYEKDAQDKDKYGRLLAHVYTPDNINVSQWLLKQGLATILFIPPSQRHFVCYKKAEQEAQQAKRGLWGLPAFQLRDISSLGPKSSGYMRLEGKVLKVERRRNKVTLVLGKKGSQIRVVIKSPELRLFKKDLSVLRGSRVQITGILYRYGQRAYIRLRHPAYLQVLSS